MSKSRNQACVLHSCAGASLRAFDPNPGWAGGRGAGLQRAAEGRGSRGDGGGDGCAGLEMESEFETPFALSHMSDERRKKGVGTGVWPCKMNGCNKQFAREADLKRHQRTTKLHSMPSFPCPQCDANFTRTDALRRHQKSRHNGLVIEPPDDEQPRSRSATPSLKGKERATPVPQPGPSSYYRSHTATTTRACLPLCAPPRSPRIAYVPIGLPTSSVRTPWPDPSPPTWPVYYHSPHYRPHTNAYHTGRSPPPPSASTSSVPPEPQPHPPGTADLSACIDPQLDAGEMTAADVVAAVRAVLLQAQAAEEEEKEKEKRAAEAAAAAVAAASKPPENASDDLRRPEPMEHILTEDGEPMLNPAELLTQESLASPPPS